MNRLNISVAEDLQEFINEQIQQKGYSDVSEYINHLIQKDKEKEAENHLENLLLEGLDSGEAIAVTNQWLNEKKQLLLNHLNQEK